MSETPKTLLFVAAAAVVALAAWLASPAPFELPRQETGDRLFPDLKDVASADALEIVRFDKTTGEPAEVKVRRQGDQWVIASHNDYPADGSGAKDRIRDVTLKLVDLEVTGLASEVTSDHGEFGVVSPKEKKAKDSRESEIGVLVALQDAGGRNLAELIVGNRVRGDEEQRFVRKGSDSVVYTAKIDVSKLSTKFDEWIEPDLLDVNSGDIRQVTLKDYSAEMVARLLPTGQLLPVIQQRMRYEMTADWNSEASAWNVADFQEWKGDRLAPAALTEEEELNKEKLDALKQAIDDLKIINVESKPKELIAEIKSDEDLLRDTRLQPLLESKGFLPIQKELLGVNGEMRFQTEEGVEYILRFGREASITGGGDEEAKLNRYLLVSARVAENQFIAPPPTIPPATEPPATEPPAPATTAAPSAADDAADAEPAETTVTSDAAEAPAEVSPETNAADNPPAPEPPPADVEAAPEEPAPVDEMAEKRKKAEEKVAELNKKFSRWYYVISEDVYKKLHLGRFDVIQAKGNSSFGLDELRELPTQPPLEVP
ncbi:MAG: DUF4340 domain-containing protein [Planctomycetales bacterium]|nr:DUF4340 domain-containing protein [Planctomycetales bacterium]